VQGSFHVSTADYLGLADRTRFSAISPGDNQVLTTAAPEAFGFLGDNPNSITLAQAELKVPSGESLSVIGGEIDIEGGELIALGGRIDLTSVNSKGEVVRQDNDLRLEGFEQLGKIELTHSAKIDTSGEGGGAIFIRGGQLTLNESKIKSDTLGAGEGKAVDIRLPQGTLELGNGGVIRAVTKGAGNGGDLFIESRNISLNHDGSESGTSFLSGTISSGDGGDIKVTTESLELVNGAGISSLATDTSTGSGGDVFIEAVSVRLSGEGVNGPATVSTFTDSSGNAGDLTIQANTLDVNAGAQIGTLTSGSGKGGSVSIESGQVRMTGRLSNISAISKDTGNSQDITIKSDSLEISNGAVIDTAVSEGTGNSASLLIESKDIVLSGTNQPKSFTGILGGSFNDTDAGKVTLIAENLDIRNRASVSTSTLGTGNSGDLLVTAENILLSGLGSLKTSASIDSSGNAGKLVINAGNLELRDEAIISTATFGTGNGGDLLVTTGNILIAGGNLVSLAAKVNSGDAGDIFIKADTLEMHSDTGISNDTVSVISSDTQSTGTGAGGDITIEADNILLKGGNTQISALTTDMGNAGNVTLIADNLELRNGSRVATLTDGSGTGGDLFVTAGNIVLSDSVLLAGTRRDNIGNSGGIIIQADNLDMSDGASISTSTIGAGNAGKVDIKTNQLDVLNGSTIAALTRGIGDGGDVIVKAGNILLSGDDSTDFTGIVAISIPGDDGVGGGDTGDAGDVTIVSTHLDIRDGASIATSTIGTGKAGNVSIEGRSVLLSGDGSSRNTGLFSNSLDDSNNAGDAGKITLTADHSLRMLDGASISVETETANAGDINISADNLLQVRDSKVTTSVAGGQGNGGNILIGQVLDSLGRLRVPNVTVLDGSEISARAEQGMGGEIGITSDFIFRNNSIVNASSRGGGIDGTVNITSPETNISGSIVALPESFINASEQLSQRCAARSTNNSSFVVKDRSEIPPGPEDAAFSTYFENVQQRRFANDTMANRDRSIVNKQLVATTADSFISRVNRENNTASVLTEYDCGE
jgi:large exoprotein involved in heme utilization and adhesion